MNDEELKRFLVSATYEQVSNYIIQGKTADEIDDRRHRVNIFSRCHRARTLEETIRMRQLDDEKIKEIQNTSANDMGISNLFGENDYFKLNGKKRPEGVSITESGPMGIWVHHKIKEVIKTVPKKIVEKIEYRDVIKEVEVEVVKYKDEQEIQQNYQCPVCFENAINVIFQCGHGICAYCESKTKTTRCFYCRQDIVNRIKLFL